MAEYNGTKNLIPMSERTKSKQKEIATKGGKASGVARRRKKEMRKQLEILVSLSMGQGKKADIEKAKNIKDFSKENITVEQAMLLAQVQKALKGDPVAFEMIRDLLGEKPTDKKEIIAEVKNNNPYSELTTDELRQLINDERTD